MSSNDTLTIPQAELVEAWRDKLPELLETGFEAEIKPDDADPHAFWVEMRTSGHEELSLIFCVRYVDSREIDVRLSDVQQAGKSIDESGDSVQMLIANCRRQLHQCAQALHEYTHA